MHTLESQATAPEDEAHLSMIGTTLKKSCKGNMQTNDEQQRECRSSSTVDKPLKLLNMAHSIGASTLAQFIIATFTDCVRKLVIVDCRNFIAYHELHVMTAINAFYSKIIRRRVIQNKLYHKDILNQLSMQNDELKELSAKVCANEKLNLPDYQLVLYDSSPELDDADNNRHSTKQGGDTLQSINDDNYAASKIDAQYAKRQCCDAQLMHFQPTPTIGSPSLGTFEPKHKICSARQNCTEKTTKINLESKETRSEFMRVLMEKILAAANFDRVMLLEGGFAEFKTRYPELCESSATTDDVSASPSKKAPSGPVAMSPRYSQNSLSQPCLPLTSTGPTKILPYLYLGSQQDAMDENTLKRHAIEYVVNLSINCPRPAHIGQQHFLRIPVNDSYQEKLAPHFEKAFQFIDAAHQANAIVLVHCLAGISRSPTLAIAYIMTHLHMSSDEAYTYVKRKRPSISPNFNFMGQLLEYEKRLKKTQGKEVAARLRQQNNVKKAPNPRRSMNQIARTNINLSSMTGAGISSGLRALFNKMKERAIQAPDEMTLSDTDANTARIQVINETISKVEKGEIHFRKEKKGDDDGDFIMTDDEDTTYMRRSLSCPIKMQKSASETRLSIRGRPEFDDFVEEQPTQQLDRSSFTQTNENGKRPAATVSDAIDSKVTCSMAKSQSMHSTFLPSALSRPCGGLFDRWRQKRSLNIPHAVKEDLPSPSTDLNQRLSFHETTPQSTTSSVANPFFGAHLCASSLCGIQATTIDTTTPGVECSPSFAQVVSQQPGSSIEPMECHSSKMSIENPMFRQQSTANSQDVYRQSTSSTDSGMSVGVRQNSANKISNLARQEIVEESSELGFCRSSSETRLSAIELESPESGFCDNRPRQYHTENQIDRTSLTGSSSSLEIPVN